MIDTEKNTANHRRSYFRPTKFEGSLEGRGHGSRYEEKFKLWFSCKDINIHIDPNSDTYLNTHIYTYSHIYTYPYKYKYKHIHTYTYTYTHKYT